MATFRASDIARWFIAWAENVDAEVSNLKLQQLLYYAQGHRLGEKEHPLFGDAIRLGLRARWSLRCTARIRTSGRIRSTPTWRWVKISIGMTSLRFRILSWMCGTAMGRWRRGRCVSALIVRLRGGTRSAATRPKSGSLRRRCCPTSSRGLSEVPRIPCNVAGSLRRATAFKPGTPTNGLRVALHSYG